MRPSNAKVGRMWLPSDQLKGHGFDNLEFDFDRWGGIHCVRPLRWRTIRRRLRCCRGVRRLRLPA